MNKLSKDKNYQKVKKIFEDNGDEVNFTSGQNLTTNKYLPGNIWYSSKCFPLCSL